MRAIACAALFALPRDAVRAQVPSADSLKQVVKQATYIFEGVVQRWNAVADSALTPNPRHAVVTVTQVFSCPVAVGEFGNENVTIRYPNPTRAPAGTRAWFLGTGWVIGDHVATTVLSLIPTPSSVQVDSVLANLQSAIRLSVQAGVQASAAAADTIVIATVQSVGPPRQPQGARSEHAVRWSTVQLVVDSVRGIVRGGTSERPTFDVGWVSPAVSAMRILVPEAIVTDSNLVTRMAVGDRRLLFLDLATRRPNLRSVDSLAVAFVANRADVGPLSDAALLGNTLPNPVLGMQPVHPCGTPFFR